MKYIIAENAKTAQRLLAPDYLPLHFGALWAARDYAARCYPAPLMHRYRVYAFTDDGALVTSHALEKRVDSADAAA